MTASDRPACSVVIATWNRRREMQTLLDSVFAQTIAANIEVIVVDNASTDGTVEWLRDEYPHPVRLFRFPRNMGASHGRNAGIRLARAAHVCFLDSDAEILSPDAIEKCLAALKANPVIRAVSVPIWCDRARTRVFALGAYITPEGHFDGAMTQTRRDDPMLISTCFAVWEKALLEELRGFDPWYFWGIEDMDLSLRAYFNALRGRGPGTRFLIVGGVECLHEMSKSGRLLDRANFVDVFRFYERQRLYLVLAYGGVREMLRVLVRTPLRRAKAAETWMTPLTKKQWILMLLLYPALRLVCLPWDWWRMRRNHLKRCPAPETVKDFSAHRG